MKVTRLTYPNINISERQDGMSIALGYFDGVHTGHQHVINKAIEIAQEKGLKSAVMTFDPHPVTVLKNVELTDYLITTLDEKITLFEQLGVDEVIVSTFNEPFSKLKPEQFVNLFLLQQNVQHVVAGFDYSFGHKGAGKIQNMDNYSEGQLPFTIIDQVSYDEEKISSTKIREMIRSGNIKACQKWLGRPYQVENEVIKGHQRGREIGYPTANLLIPAGKVIPKTGVYTVTATVNGKQYEGVANLGFNPTFSDDLAQPILEVNLFDFNENIYGEMMNVYFHQYIREEEKFDSVQQLIEQMKDDEAISRKYFNES